MRTLTVFIITLATTSLILTTITVQQLVLGRYTEGDIVLDRPSSPSLFEQSYAFVYSNSFSLSIISWTGLIGAVIWKRKVSKIWFTNGFDYNQFALMVKMRGSRTRLEILKGLNVPKTRKLIAEELQLNWRTIDRHVYALRKNGLIREICNVGQAVYYIRSEKGDKLLNFMENGYSNSYNTNDNSTNIQNQ